MAIACFRRQHKKRKKERGCDSCKDKKDNPLKCSKFPEEKCIFYQNFDVIETQFRSCGLKNIINSCPWGIF